MGDEEEVERKYEVQFDGDEAKLPFLSKDGQAAGTCSIRSCFPAFLKSLVLTAKFANGDTYTGAYVGGKRQGQGVYTWSNPSASYTGEWQAGKRHGTGTMTYPDKSKYEGDWVDGQRHGRGLYSYSNGDRFLGTFDKDVKNGEGTYVYGHDGSMIAGRWANGKLISGQWTSKDGTKMSGTFSDHVPTGEVLFAFPNGNQMSGRFDYGHWQPGVTTAWD